MANIDKLTQARDVAALKAETARLKLIERKIRNVYDGAEQTRKRRNSPIERADDDGILTSSKRLTGVAQTRDLNRNYSNAKGFLHQFAINVVGSLGKLQINTPGSEQQQAWFNGTWAKACDARDDNHWSDILQCIVTASIREGDVGVAVDDGWLDGDGKIWTWEADQFCNLNESDFKADTRFANATQQNGIVRDKMGRILGYFVTGKRGQTSCKADECTYMTRENMRLVKRPWRLNQGRGVADFLTAVNDMFDLYDARARELQSMKTAAAIAGFTRRKEAVTDYDAPLTNLGLLPENQGKSESELGDELAQGGDSPNYERFESLTGGMWEYVDKDDDIVFPDINRPNPNMQEFHDFVLTGAGASLGLARAYSRMRADTSYTAFRGDMIMTWETFYCLQKWLERRVCDWVAVKVLTNAQTSGEISSLPEGWENSLSWQWPVMPEVNEGAFEKAMADKMRNGRGTLSDSVGPAWREKIEQLGREKEAAEKAGITLPTMTTVAGAMVPQNNGDNDNGDTN